MTYNKLTKEEEYVIEHKGTEAPFTGQYNDHSERGVYICRRCERALYESESKFKSGCGWPSFDDEILGAVRKEPDADGMRVEILCMHCGGHLGHVFHGENFTNKNTRHCVNSLSLEFVSEKDLGLAIFASGCFWGTEYHLQKLKGVVSTATGYIGGETKHPSYKEVCTGATGHAEAVEVLYKKAQISYDALLKCYFETHDPGQLNRQGPDIGTQYRSEVFYLDEDQKKKTEEHIQLLKNKGYEVVTKVTPASKFWVAEDYHQDYYEHKGMEPYCHIYEKKF